MSFSLPPPYLQLYFCNAFETQLALLHRDSYPSTHLRKSTRVDQVILWEQWVAGRPRSGRQPAAHGGG